MAHTPASLKRFVDRMLDEGRGILIITNRVFDDGVHATLMPPVTHSATRNQWAMDGQEFTTWNGIKVGIPNWFFDGTIKV